MHGVKDSDAVVNSDCAKAGETVFLIYDLETTGFDVCKDKIVQIAICVMRVSCNKSTAFETLLEFCSYVNPNGRRMSKGAERVTGLTTVGPEGSRLRRAPFFKEVWQRDFVPKYKEATKCMVVDEVCLVGHNSKRYDDLLLISEMIYAGIRMQKSLGIENITCRDSHVLAKQLQGRLGRQTLPRTRLGAMYSYFTNGKELQNAHDALADCRATGLIIERMWDGNPVSFPHVKFCDQVATFD